jgi:hypothetical protein
METIDPRQVYRWSRPRRADGTYFLILTAWPQPYNLRVLVITNRQMWG